MTERNYIRKMQHRRQSAISRILAIILLCCSYNTAFSSNKVTQNKDQNQLKDLQKNIAEKEKSVKEQQQQRENLLKQLKKQEQSISIAGKTLHETQSNLSQINSQIASLTSRIHQLKKKKSQQESLLAKQVDAAFRLGKNQSLELMFKGDDGQREERILAYYNYINESRKKTIEEVQTISQELQSEQQQQKQKQINQKNTLSEQQQKKQKLDSAKSERQKTLVVLESSLKQDQKNLAILKQNEARLRDKLIRAERAAKARAEREAKEAARIKAQVAEKARKAKQKGKVYTPTKTEQTVITRKPPTGLSRTTGSAMWPVRGPIFHNYGEVISSELRWKGMVIGASEGTQVKAVAAGRVILADWLQGYGLIIVVDHGQGDMSLYGYNQSALVNVGQQVQAGQSIALVGNSGGQERSSLYFEIRRQGKTINPRSWLGG